MHQARAQSKPPEWSRPDLVASAERIPQQVGVLFSFEHCGLKTLAAFVLGRSFLALKWFPNSRPFQFAHALFDSLTAKVLTQRDRDAVSRADVMQQEVAVRVNRPVLERVGMEAGSPRRGRTFTSDHRLHMASCAADLGKQLRPQ